MPIRYTTEDTRSEEQANADDRVRNEVERTGGIWGRMTPEQRAQIRARLHDKKRRAQAAGPHKQAEQKPSRNVWRNWRSGSHDSGVTGHAGRSAVS